MSKSIRYYYFTSITAVLVCSVLVMGIIQMYLATNYFRQEKETLLGRVVMAMAAGVQEGQIVLDGSERLDVAYMAEVSSAVVLLADPTGTVLYGTGRQESNEGRVLSQAVREEIGHSGVYSEVGSLDGLYNRSYYTMAASLSGPDGTQAGYVIASSDAQGLRVYLVEMMSGFVLSAGVVLLVASMVALVLTNRTVIPIRRVSEAARQFGEGNYSARVPVEGDDELAQLAITFNEMAQSFEATDRSRRSFMGNISHELRTPMTTIKGFIDGMLDGTIPESQRDKYLKIVSAEVGRLARLTQNMLDISRLESGEYSPNTTVFDVWGPIASVFIAAEQRLEEKHIELEGMEPYPPVNVLADADFVHQILFNLSDNAIKFVEEGGTIRVGVAQQRSMVTISVTNTGGGIPENSKAYIFERFYKADESRGLNARGAGLGLHICKVLTNLMGGRIWVASEKDETTFSFTLPTAPLKRASPRRSEPRRQNTQEAE